MRRQGLLGGSLILLAGRIGAAVISAGWLFVAARQLGLTGFGDLALLLTVYGIFGVIADLGLPVLLAARVAEAGHIDAELLRTVIRRRLLASILACGVVTVAFLLVSEEGIGVPLLFAGSIVGNALHSTYSAALRSIGRIWPEGINEVVSRLAVLLVGLGFLAAGAGVVGAAIAYSVADLASSVALRSVVRRHLSSEVNGAGRRPILLRNSVPLVLAASIGGAYHRIDAWLLGLLDGPETTGLYAAAYRPVEILLMPATVLGANAIAHVLTLPPPDRARRLGQLAAAAATSTAVAALLLAPLRHQLIRALYGPVFEPSASILRVLLVSAVPGAVVAALAPMSAATSGAAYAGAIASALTLNVLANLVLIPGYGAIGAAWANAASQVLLAAALLISLLRHYRVRETSALPRT